MNQLIISISGFGVILCLLGYWVGVFIKKKMKHPVFNPLLIAVVLVILFLFMFDIDYALFRDNSEQLSYLLTPATVSLAIPLSRQIQLLRKNYKAVLIGCFSGVAASFLCILGFCLIFQISYTEYATLLPKSITTAFGMGVSGELGGMVNVTIAAIIVSGIIGNVFAEAICKIARINSPIAKGIGIGCAAHAIGTSKAMEMGETEGAVSGLALIVSGILTVILAPVFAGCYG